MRQTLVLALALTAFAAQDASAQARLQISEFAVTPTAGEFVEIYNPNSFTVDLTDVYITDATFANGGVFYYNIVLGGGAGGGGGFADWFARFPAGATIGGGEFQTIALNGLANFALTYGVNPTYEIEDDDGFIPDGVPDMLPAGGGIEYNAGMGGHGLTNNGEVVILFHWDGVSDLVTDLDYVTYGASSSCVPNAEGVDKTGISIDSATDGDAIPSTYLNDTPVASQSDASNGVAEHTNCGPGAAAHTSGNTLQRVRLSEGTETRSGGNGITDATLAGNDETSENTHQTFQDLLPTPNAAPPGGITIRLTPGTAGANTFEMAGATPFSLTLYLVSLAEGYVPAPCVGEGLGAVGGAPVFNFAAPTDGAGGLSLPVTVPAAPGASILVQCYDLTSCTASNMTRIDL